MTKTQTKLLEALITAGQECAGCCLTGCQGKDVAGNAAWIRLMRKKSEAWDKALQEYRQAQTMKRT
jgi:hypothetical protein